MMMMMMMNCTHRLGNDNITTILFSEISLNLFWETSCFIQANLAWPPLCRLSEYQL